MERVGDRRDENTGKEINIRRLNKARQILSFAGDLLQCKLPRKQMKRLARNLEKLQVFLVIIILQFTCS